MNDVVRALLLGLTAAALTGGGALVSDATAGSRALMLGALSFLVQTALAGWFLKAAAGTADEAVHAAKLEKVRVERDFQKLRGAVDDAKKKQLDTSSFMLALQSIARSTGQTLEVAKVLELVIEILQKHVGAKRCSIWLLEPSGQVRLECATGWSEGERIAARVDLGRGVIGHTLRHARVIDCETMKRDPQTMVLARESKIPSMICAPLAVGGEVLGALNIEEWADSHKTNLVDDVRLTEFLGTVAATALKNARTFQDAQDRANTDGLTRLFNHRYFQDQLDREILRAERYGGCCSVILTDIDHFKKFNDTHGHQIGDLVLRETATCFKTAGLDEDATLARYGGEEFVVLLPQASKIDAAKVAEHLRQTVEARAVETEGKVLQVTISLGVSTYPEDAARKAQLIEMADHALYRAKRAGRNRVQSAGPEDKVA